GFLARLASRHAFWIFIATVAACLLMALMTDKFLTPQNIFNITRNFAFVGIIAIGMTAVIITGGIDLSVGGTMLIGAMVTAVAMNSGMPIVPAFFLAMAACTLVGLINGVFIAVLGLPAFVVTLGMMS